ncbi:MAG: DUF4832 domain-containing protein, partial [Sphingomonas sp.]
MSILLLTLGASLVAQPASDGHRRPANSPPKAVGSMVRTTFQPAPADFPNPERGFYLPVESDLAGLSPREVATAYAKGYRLIYVRIDLEPYRDRALPRALLDRLDSAFAIARREGVKLIVRASYNEPHGETGYQQAQDAPLDRVLDHLNALAPVWKRNGDVIAFVQAGLIGAWGEWHTSSNGLTAVGPRTRIRDALLAAAPDDRFVQFRYPPYLIDWTPRLPSIESAMSGRFRIGFHNDCFLASRTDVGTYDEDPARRRSQQAYTDRLGDLAPFGGETCNPADDAGATPRTRCADIRADGARFNLTYLNASYYRRLFHDRWTHEGCMAEVTRKMGYRIVLSGVSHPASVARGAQLGMRVALRNAGWARIYNPRGVRLILRTRDSGAVRALEVSGVDPRRWLPGSTSTEAMTVRLPADMAPGSY